MGSLVYSHQHLKAKEFSLHCRRKTAVTELTEIDRLSTKPEKSGAKSEIRGCHEENARDATVRELQSLKSEMGSKHAGRDEVTSYARVPDLVREILLDVHLNRHTLYCSPSKRWEQ